MGIQAGTTQPHGVKASFRKGTAFFEHFCDNSEIMVPLDE
jgi:hypothetical protein